LIELIGLLISERLLVELQMRNIHVYMMLGKGTDERTDWEGMETYC
jgi:hypothetical protein